VAIITTSNLKTFIGDDSSTNDTVYGWAVDAANKWVPGHCQRTFDISSSSSARVYAPTHPTVLRVHDFTGTPTISNDGATVASGDYQLEPLNGLAQDGTARPYEQIRLLSGTWSQTYDREASVTVTAAWGWAAVPSEVFEATLILAADLYSNRDKRYGIVSFTEFAGVRARQNPVVTDLLAPYRRVESWGVA
jgi:hypothetical protein